MTDERMALIELIEKQADPDLLREMLGNHPVPPRDVHNPNASPEALGHDPSLHLLRPFPIDPRPLDNRKRPPTPSPSSAIAVFF